MLRKLLKHDMRSMWHSAMPLLTVSGILSVICCGILYFSMSYLDGGAETDFLDVAMLVGIFYFIGIIAIIALQSVITVITVVRYYKSIFTDEGYLTMVLPIEHKTLIHEKILFTLIWFAISGVAMILEFIVAVFLPIFLYEPSLLEGLVEFINSINGLFFNEGYGVAINVLQIIDAIIYFFEGAMLTLAAITVGAMVMKRKKVLGAFLFYFITVYLRENVVLVFELVLDIIMISATNTSLGVMLSLIFSILISTAITVAAYLTMKHIFTKKFNIE